MKPLARSARLARPCLRDCEGTAVADATPAFCANLSGVGPCCRARSQRQHLLLPVQPPLRSPRPLLIRLQVRRLLPLLSSLRGHLFRSRRRSVLGSRRKSGLGADSLSSSAHRASYCCIILRRPRGPLRGELAEAHCRASQAFPGIRRKRWRAISPPRHKLRAMGG